MSKIHYSPESLHDMDRIWDHITCKLQNPSSAERLIESILDAVSQLETFPAMGTPLSSVTNDCIGYRFLVVGNYMIFYRFCGGDVYIDRILYGRCDYLRILFDTK